MFLLLFAAASILALFAARSLSGSNAWFLLLCGGLLRATLLFRQPDLSDDLQRYLWDARVGAAGVSPYAFAPADPALARIAPELRVRLSHADVRTVYPPAAQAAFRAGRLLGASGLPLKALFAAADLSIVPLILVLGGPNGAFAAALYAFHPLAVTESAGEGHLDALGVALLLASLVSLGRQRRVRAGVAFALSVLTKLVPLCAAIPLLRRGRLTFAAASLATGVSIWVAATQGGVAPLGGLSDYAARWEFNAPLYAGLDRFFAATELPERAKGAFLRIKEWLGHPAWMQSLFPFFDAGFFARAALAVVLAAALLTIAWRARSVEGAVFASLGALLLASPTLQPWYLLWVLPFAARRREPAFLYLSFAVAASYALLYPVAWLPRPLVFAVEFAPFTVLLARSLRRRGEALA